MKDKKCSEEHKWQYRTATNTEMTTPNEGRQRTEDEGERMKTIRSNMRKPRPLDLGILEVEAMI